MCAFFISPQPDTTQSCKTTDMELVHCIMSPFTPQLSLVVTNRPNVIFCAGKFNHITPVLHNVLHWQPVTQRIHSKVVSAAFNCVRGTSPVSFKDVCTLVVEITGRSDLRSSVHSGDMFVSLTRTEFGQQSFHVAAPEHLNCSPLSSLKNSLELDSSTKHTCPPSEDFCFKSVLTCLISYLFCAVAG